MKWYIQAAIHRKSDSALIGHIDGAMIGPLFTTGIEGWKKDCIKGLEKERGADPSQIYLVIVCAIPDTY